MCSSKYIAQLFFSRVIIDVAFAAAIHCFGGLGVLAVSQEQRVY